MIGNDEAGLAALREALPHVELLAGRNGYANRPAGVDQRQQLRGGLRIAMGDRIQDTGNFAHESAGQATRTAAASARGWRGGRRDPGRFAGLPAHGVVKAASAATGMPSALTSSNCASDRSRPCSWMQRSD